jgi:signal transduction histidine kinase
MTEATDPLQLMEAFAALLDKKVGGDITDPRQLVEAFALFEAVSGQLMVNYNSVRSQLEALENEFKTVLGAVPFAIWVLGEDGELRYSNQHEALPGAFMDGPPPWELGSPDGLRRFRDFEGIENFLEQETMLTASGRIVILRDVTKQQLRAQQTTREERLQAMGMVAAELAHEIRNPLGSLSLFAGMLVEDLADSPEPLELASKIQEGVNRMNILVTNLLIFSRDLSPKTRALPIRDFWEEAKDAAKVPDGLEWHNKVPDNAIWEADPEMLRQVAVNLLQNSMRAMENSPAPRLSIIAHQEEFDSTPHWHIAVEDTGCGIPKDALHRIFDPFYSTFGAGTGLGLTVSHRIITAHGGLLHVESEEGVGTTMRLMLRARG